MTAILNVDARYYITYQANKFLVWLDGKTLIAVDSKEAPEAYARLHCANQPKGK